MNKQEIYQYLDENNIPYERTEHKAVFSMEELKAIPILYPDLQSYLGLTPGAVTPFGLLNDTQHKVRFYLDADFSGQRIGVHPNDNAATVWLKVSDLVNLLREHGSIVEIAEL